MDQRQENEELQDKGEPTSSPPVEPSSAEGEAYRPPVGEQLARLQAELDEEQKEKGQFRNLLQRVQADFINYKRRMEEERREQQILNSAHLLLNLLPVLDDFQRALESVPEEQRSEPWRTGMEMIQRKLQTLLENEGVSRLQPHGQRFDPAQHEALLHQESDEHPEGQITAVIRDGYALHGKVLRPAQVIVAKGRPQPTDGPETAPPGGAKDTKEE